MGRGEPSSAGLSDYEFRFTVFTPTYNRADTLHRPYESLKEQSFDDFEWVIVDDYSSDDTAEVVEEWIEADETDFPIRFFQGENWYDEPGKPRAHNLAVEKAKGELFLPLDSDDKCIPKALEKFDLHWRSIPKDIRQEFSGVACLCKDQYGEIVGELFPAPVLEISHPEMRHIHRRGGERWGFQRTDLLRRFPFPTPSGERYVPEGVVWSQLGEQFNLRFVNEALRIYWREETDTEAISDLSHPKKHAQGHVLLHRAVLNNELYFRYLRHNPTYFVKSGGNLIRFALFSNQSIILQYQELNKMRAKVFLMLCTPIGVLFFILDRLSITQKLKKTV